MRVCGVELSGNDAGVVVVGVVVVIVVVIGFVGVVVGVCGGVGVCGHTIPNRNGRAGRNEYASQHTRLFATKEEIK